MDKLDNRKKTGLETEFEEFINKVNDFVVPFLAKEAPEASAYMNLLGWFCLQFETTEKLEQYHQRKKQTIGHATFHYKR